MYKPVKDGIEKHIQAVSYNEIEPPEELCNLVHCFWELKTLHPLPEDFKYHVLPDACVNILFNQRDIDITDITTLQTTHKILNLSNDFHYTGIQLLPGVWKGNFLDTKNQLVDQPYKGPLPLIEMNKKLINHAEFSDKQDIFIEIVEAFRKQGLIEENKLIHQILTNISDIHNISDMANVANLSTRQLQRKLKEMVWLSPHDFLKILRIQQSFRHSFLDYYADQSHYIHSFRKITGYTPVKYNKKYDV